MALDLDEAQEWRNNCRKMADVLRILKEEVMAAGLSEESAEVMCVDFYRQSTSRAFIPDLSQIFGAMIPSPEEEEGEE